MKRFAILVLVLVALAPLTMGKEAAPSSDDPQLEERLKKLSSELRCLVCQNETLADSQADLAEDLRREIREQMRAGKSDKEIVSYLTARYGDFVLYRPPVKPTTYLLWFGPFILLAVGLIVLFKYVRRRSDTIREVELTDADRARAAEILHEQAIQEDR